MHLSIVFLKIYAKKFVLSHMHKKWYLWDTYFSNNPKTINHKRRNKMAQITSKELGGISDLLAMEKNLIAKYKEDAEKTTDSALKNSYEQIAMQHQRHYDELFANLK